MQRTSPEQLAGLRLRDQTNLAVMCALRFLQRTCPTTRFLGDDWQPAVFSHYLNQDMPGKQPRAPDEEVKP